MLEAGALEDPEAGVLEELGPACSWAIPKCGASDGETDRHDRNVADAIARLNAPAA